MLPRKNIAEKRIVIVDDDASVRDSLKKVLQEAGYEVVLATDGEAGAECLSRQESDLLILDLDLPKLSGFDLLDLLAECDPLLPVIVLTGQADQCEPGALAGANVLLEKPPDVGMLLETVAGLLDEATEARAGKALEGLASPGSLPPGGPPRLPRFPTRPPGAEHPGQPV